MKTQKFEKKAIFPVKKNIWQTFLILSSMTDLREWNLRVHMNFWHLV